MSAHGETRRRAFEAACTLAAEAKRPTLLAIRDRLDGRGGAQAIADGLTTGSTRRASASPSRGSPRSCGPRWWPLGSGEPSGGRALGRGAGSAGGAPGGG